ncbi:ATP-binding protein [Psychromonas hadalis]|uniref:ATP-binding protein n=1 Tax=Psychromonas hadalis TaxID=211669 RepID=UPI0003B5EFF1|nr:ATP-binding protein [Psychromonas hadalis]
MYIAIQQTRFPYIRFIESINEKLKEQMLPPLLIQPLIENAIVHGLAPQGHQGVINLTIKSELMKLIIEVSDDGIGFDDVKASDQSVALKNIKARLQLHHPLSTITILEPDQGATVQITIPLNES